MSDDTQQWPAELPPEEVPPTQAPAGSMASYIVSILVLALVLVVLIEAYVLRDMDIFKIAAGAVLTMGTTIVNYWVGSSRESARKTETIAQIATSKGFIR